MKNLFAKEARFFSKSLHERDAAEERRSYWRFVFKGVECLIKKRAFFFSQTAKAVIADISEAGIFFQTPMRLRKGNKIEIVLRFSVRPPVVFKAYVARAAQKGTGEYGAGCFFKSLNPHDVEFMRQFVWWHEFTAQETSSLGVKSYL